MFEALDFHDAVPVTLARERGHEMPRVLKYLAT